MPSRRPRSNVPKLHSRRRVLPSHARRSTARRSKLRCGCGDGNGSIPHCFASPAAKSGLGDVRSLRYNLDPRRHLPHGFRQALRRRGAGSPRDSRRLLDRPHPGHKPPFRNFVHATGEGVPAARSDGGCTPSPQDRAYTVPELYAWLDRCGMSFGRWIEQAPYLAHCGSVARSPHAARRALLPSRLQPAAVELFRGTMVSNDFIAHRDDRPEVSQPINFAGYRWRDYIPIALPWTVCVRERLPPGSVAVLINRSHKFTDLVCTIDSFEDRVLGAIDGNRTLAEILQLAAQDGDGTRRALRFFERLWQYDQVVFDASRAANEPSGP
jgi:hypothetical protein